VDRFHVDALPLTEEHLWSARGVYTEPPFSGDALTEVGVLYGRVASAPLAFASVSAGLSVVSERSTTIGLPVQVQAYVRPIPGAGLGVTLFGNVNPVRSFAGVGIALQVGSGS